MIHLCEDWIYHVVVISQILDQAQLGLWNLIMFQEEPWLGMFDFRFYFLDFPVYLSS